MSTVAILTYATVIATALVVLVLVFYLTGILIALIRAGNRLQKVVTGLQAVEGHTQPLAMKLQTINGALGQIKGGLTAIDGRLVGIASIFRLT